MRLRFLIGMMLVALLGFGASVSAFAQQPSGSFALPGVAKEPQTDVVYGVVDGTTLKMDVYAPVDDSAAGWPAVVLIHGGGWTSYDKSSMDAMGKWLAMNGFVAFSIDYRLLSGTKNRWPAQLDDAQRAVRWVRAHSKEYGVNPAKIGAFGHSAGAQMVSLLGELETRDNSDKALAGFSSKVQAVVDVSGPVDFSTFSDPEDKKLLEQLMGGTEKEKAAEWKAASPAEMIGKDTAPFLILHGTKDERVPVAQAEEFATKLEKAGVPVTLIKVDDGHTFSSPEARKLLAFDTVTFFAKYLK